MVLGEQRDEPRGPLDPGRARIGDEEQRIGLRARYPLRPEDDTGCGVDEPWHPYSLLRPPGPGDTGPRRGGQRGRGYLRASSSA